MKKLLAGSGIAGVITLATWGAAAPAQAYPNDTPPGDTTPSSEVLGSEAASSPGSGVLPSTGGPETLVLIGGAALLAVGGAALVGARRRAND